MVPLIWLASAAQQKIWFTSLISCAGKRSLVRGAGTCLIIAFGGIVIFGGAGSLMVGCLGWVDRTSAGVFFIWPLAVAVDGGRYLRAASAVRPGHDEKCLLLMALIHVDGGGLNVH